MGEKKASDEGMVKYGVQPDTLTKEATVGVEEETKCVICGEPEGKCEHTRVKKP